MMLIDFDLKINFSTVIALFLGIILGMIILFLIYTLTSLNSIKKRRIIVSKELENITDEDIKNLINISKEQFNIKRKQNKGVTFDDFRVIVVNLINQIAYRFYPKSKHPIAELTIDELILLDRYLINRIDSFTSKKGLRLIKKVKISTIIEIINTKNSVENTKTFKTIKKGKLDKVATTIWTIGHILNPVTWINKLIINPTIKMLFNKICIVVISIVGQETYHIYSKKIFTEANDELELLELVEKLNLEEKEKELV
ncbi:MAG: hypothetical protein J1F31_04950 [Erysipelotrichales bacterium]|nr:hypothetical protein [Erysipelotrichales bacterium]